MGVINKKNTKVLNINLKIETNKIRRRSWNITISFRWIGLLEYSKTL